MQRVPRLSDKVIEWPKSDYQGPTMIDLERRAGFMALVSWAAAGALFAIAMVITP